MQLVPASRVEPDLWLLDLDFQGRPGVVAAYLITGPQGHTLVETGPGSTLPALERAVAATGARLDEITQIAVTHIHLDHAGAAGALLHRLPGARLFVHPAGAPHMIDPSKLIASATRIYGDRMDPLWGAFEPCPAERVVILDDGAELRAGARTLQALHTPGHASHHIAFHDPERRTLFTGDVGGVRLQGASYVRRRPAPPALALEAWHHSVDRMRATRPRALDLTHFGRFTDPARHLDELLTRLDAWVKWTADQLAAGVDPTKMMPELALIADSELLAEGIADPSLVEAYELATPTPMTVNGIVRYLTRRPKAG
jgi:glyoxylase-like metal-dependent hydrolase (beta-lactamase superfamily II)